MIEIVAGIDIGATNTLIGLVDKNGKNYRHINLKTQEYASAELFVKKLAHAILSALNSLGPDYALTGVGIGAPNGNHHNGNLEFAVNLPWKEEIPLASMMQQYFDVPVRLTNDANAAAMGEMIFGAARHMKDFIVITLGTGLGSGIVVNGKVVYGHDGNAGELGHVIVVPGGRECGCGRRGCLETYVSATGITRTVKQMLEDKAVQSVLRDDPIETLDSKKIYQAAVYGDEIALKAFDVTCKIFGSSLANTVAFSSPEAIILSGGLAQAWQFIIESTKRYMEDEMLKVFKNKVRILPSELPENIAAILGAAALVWEEE